MENANAPKCLFLVEGKTDKIVFSSILKKLHISNANCVDCNGIDKLLNDLTTFIKGSDARSIGIIVDANQSLGRRWQSIRDKLIRSDLEFELPKTPCHCGTVQEFGDQVIGIWVMPDNQKSGVLEDFVTELIPKDDVWELACDFVERAMDKGIPINESKSQVYAWLSIVAPGIQMGTAFKANKLEFDTTNYKNFENWIKALCG